MSQSSKGSMVEAFCNVGSGMFVAYIIAQILSLAAPLIQMYIMPSFDFHISAETNLITTPIFTVVSMLRSWGWRRVFVKWFKG